VNSIDLQKDINETCRFCNPPDKERILYETENFYVMLSLGPLTEGYLLICSKKHLESCGLIDSEQGDEFDNLTKNVSKILKEVYGSCLFYEHGRVGSCLTFSESSKHCHHAHLHCVPVNVPLNKFIDEDFYTIKHDSWSDFRKSSKEYYEPYLFVHDGEMKSHFVIKKDIRRQYLRHKTATLIDKSELWDWVKHQGWEKIERAKKKLAPEFKKIKEFV
jgi:diadenosine tetraphosphate (Ap4A) HIT family hydrolase